MYGYIFVFFHLFFQRETTSVTSCLLSRRNNLFQNGVNSSKKEFVPKGLLLKGRICSLRSKFLLLRIDPHKEGKQKEIRQYIVASPENVAVHCNLQTLFSLVQPLKVISHQRSVILNCPVNQVISFQYDSSVFCIHATCSFIKAKTSCTLVQNLKLYELVVYRTDINVIKKQLMLIKT